MQLKYLHIKMLRVAGWVRRCRTALRLQPQSPDLSPLNTIMCSQADGDKAMTGFPKLPIWRDFSSVSGKPSLSVFFQIYSASRRDYIAFE